MTRVLRSSKPLIQRGRCLDGELLIDYRTVMNKSALPCTADPAAIEETAELYALKRMSPSESESFEQHLLVCRRCQDAVSEFDLFLAAARSALAEYPEERTHRRGRKARATSASG